MKVHVRFWVHFIISTLICEVPMRFVIKWKISFTTRSFCKLFRPCAKICCMSRIFTLIWNDLGFFLRLWNRILFWRKWLAVANDRTCFENDNQLCFLFFFFFFSYSCVQSFNAIASDFPVAWEFILEYITYNYTVFTYYVENDECLLLPVLCYYRSGGTVGIDDAFWSWRHTVSINAIII